MQVLIEFLLLNLHMASIEQLFPNGVPSKEERRKLVEKEKQELLSNKELAKAIEEVRIKKKRERKKLKERLKKNPKAKIFFGYNTNK